MPYKDPEKRKEQKKAHYEANKNKIKEYIKAYREANKEQIKERSKAYKEANKEQIKAYREANKEQIKEQRKDYREANKEQIKEQRKDYREANKEQIKAYVNNRYNNDPNFKLRNLLRQRIKNTIKNNKTNANKSKPTIELLGCSIDFARNHLESQFNNGMTWENHGSLWEIDHIKPCSIFDLSDPEQQLECFHWTNLQPLLAEENRSWQDKLKFSVWPRDTQSDTI